MSKRSNLLAAALPLLLLAACQQKPVAPPTPVAQPVLSLVVQPVAAALPSFAGTIEAQVTTALAFRVGGRVTARSAQVGATVKANDVLASLDTTTLQLALQTAEASLASAQSQLALATGEAGRQQALLASRAVAQAAYQQAQQQQAAAQSGVVRAQANLTEARQQLSYAEITASYDGIVTGVGADVGDIVSAGQTIVTIAKPEARDAVIDVPESLVGGLKPGAAFTVALQLDPAIAVKGTVREIAPQANAATRTRQVKIGLASPPATFWLGTTVTATLQESDNAVISVPQSAIFSAGGQSQVWVVDPAALTISAKSITTGAPRNGLVPVTAGLDKGARVVVAGVDTLKEGQKVKLVEGSSL